MTRRIPLALLDDMRIKGRRLGRKPNAADRERMLAFYDAMSDHGRRAMVYLAQAIAREESREGGPDDESSQM